jgi:hypothetical protein
MKLAPALQGFQLFGWGRPEHLGAAYVAAWKHPAPFDEVQRPPQFVRGQQFERCIRLRLPLVALQGSQAPLQATRTACGGLQIRCSNVRGSPFPVRHRTAILTHRTTSCTKALCACLTTRNHPPRMGD